MPMRSKLDLIYLAVIVLFLYACSNILQPAQDGLSNYEIAQAYTELDAAVTHIDELSQPKSRSGHWPLLDAADKARLGKQVRKAKALIDIARQQVQAGATTSNEYNEARAVLDALTEEIAPLLAERDITS